MCGIMETRRAQCCDIDEYSAWNERVLNYTLGHGSIILSEIGRLG